MATVVDRRTESGDKTHSSRRRFLDRQKQAVKKAIEGAISEKNLKDIGKGGVDVTVPRDGIREPFIRHGRGGVTERVLPGNKEYGVGDKLPKPKGGGGGGDDDGDGSGQPGGKPGGKPGDGDGGMDDFVFTLSEDEFLQYLFDDLQLPNLTKQTLQDSTTVQYKRAGFVSDGPPNKLDLVRSKGAQKVRHLAFQKPHERKIVEVLEEQKAILAAREPQSDVAPTPTAKPQTGQMSLRIRTLKTQVAELRGRFAQELSTDALTRLRELDDEIAQREKKISLIPVWNDSTDLRYRLHTPKPVPAAKAVMFCLMDVSGSMTQERKNNAKVFFFLLHRFLERNYEKVDLVFIRHTTEADEVDENTFFYDGKTGGTTVSTVLAKMKEVMQKRYPPSEWNIYGAQASDGENDNTDNNRCKTLLHELMANVQAFFYTEVANRSGYHYYPYAEALWDTYDDVKDEHPGKFFMGRIGERKDIWPVFREFFKKREARAAAPGMYPG